MTAFGFTLLVSTATFAGTYDLPAGFPDYQACSYAQGRYLHPCSSHVTGDPSSCVATCEAREFEPGWGSLPGYERGPVPRTKQCIGPEPQCAFKCDEAGLRAAFTPRPGVSRILVASPACTHIALTDTVRIEGNRRGDQIWADLRGLTLAPCGPMSEVFPEYASPGLMVIDSSDVRILGLRVDTTRLDGVYDPIEKVNRASGILVYRSKNIDLTGLFVSREWEDVPGSGQCGPEFSRPLTCADPDDTGTDPLTPVGKGSEIGVRIVDSIDVAVRNSEIEGMWGTGLHVGGESTSIAVLSNLLELNECDDFHRPAEETNGKNFVIDASDVEFAGNWVGPSHGLQSELGAFTTKQGGTVCERARNGFLSRQLEVHHNVFVDAINGGVQFLQAIREMRVTRNLFAGNGQIPAQFAAADDITLADNDFDIYEFDPTKPGPETTNCHGCFGANVNRTVLLADSFGGDFPTTSLRFCCEINYTVQDLELQGSDATLVHLPILGAGLNGRALLQGQNDFIVAGDTCGDDVIDPPVEVCDDGDLNGELDACKAYCTGLTECGNAAVEGVELCDRGLGDTGDGCNDLCQLVDLDDANPLDPACYP